MAGLTGCAADHPGQTCWRLAEGGYCLAPRCYCGSCPWYVPISDLATNTPDVYTGVDRKAMLSSTGRRVNLADYRAAQRG